MISISISGVNGYVDTEEEMPRNLDKEHSCKIILSTTNGALDIVAADTAVQSIILLLMIYPTSDKEGQRITLGDWHNCSECNEYLVVKSETMSMLH
jgi:hypothetical protein